MRENVDKFFDRYDAEPELRARVQEAMDCYPGSYEIREPLVEFVLLPIAQELGLEFNVAELRAYETKKKLDRARLMEEDVEYYDEDFEGYWLLERGWEQADSKFGADKK